MLKSEFIFCVGVVTPQGVNLLGTAFIVANNKLATARHVVNGVAGNLVLIPAGENKINQYQDTSDNKVQFVPVKIVEEDPINDICILESEALYTHTPPKITGFDQVNIGEELGVIGYPHCTDGRLVLTLHYGRLGAKVLLTSSGIKSKNGILNQQARPGQSGSPVYSLKSNSIVGILIGAYSSPSATGILMGNIDPADLHQTTHCLSAEYIKDML